MAEETSSKQFIDEATNKNKTKLRCERCDSLILQELSGTHATLETAVEIPMMRLKKELVVGSNGASDQKQIESEKVTEFWLVRDMFTFENVGFTNTIDNKKYLICADCEIGPIGFQSLDKPDEFYVSLTRVKHV